MRRHIQPAIMALFMTALSSPASAASGPSLFRRDYQDTVCKPATQHEGDTIPPCVSIETIEMLCTPNGTEPVYFAAHQQCMCGGSYFSEWPACLSCLALHGLRTERDVAEYQSVLSVASSSFCGASPAPTAEFKSIFAAVQATASVPTTGATDLTDRASGQTAVSLYYTATRPQGPGLITGSAATATATGLFTAPKPSSSGGAPTTGSGGGTTTTRTSSSSGGAGSTTSPTAGSGGDRSRVVREGLILGLVAAGVAMLL